MKDENKTKAQLIDEMAALHERISQLELGEAELKEAQVVLLPAAQQWRATFDAIADGVFLLDAEGKVARCNQTMAKRLQKSPNELIGHTCWELVDGTSEPPPSCPFVLARESRRRHTMLRAVDDRWYSSVVDPMVDEDGSFVGAVCSMADVTARKQAEDAVRESEERYRTLFEGIPDGVIVHSAEKGFLDCNEAVLRRLGYSREEFLRLRPADIVHPDFLSLTHESQGGMWAGERSTVESAHVCKDGRTIQVEVNARRIEYRGMPAILAVVHDIEERKRVQEELRETEERYRLLFESSPICLWEQDFSDVKRYLEDLRRSGVSDFRAYFRKHPGAVRECTSLVKIADVNRAALDFYQAETKAELLRGLDQVFAEESYDVFMEELVSITEGRTQFDGESSARTLGGERKDIALRWSVAPGFEETLTRVVVSDVDITERKRTEEALRESEESFRYLSEAAFEAILIHEGGALIAANDQFFEMSGFQPDELLGRQVIPLIVAPEARQALGEQIAGGGEGPYESTVLRKDGTRFPVEIRARRMKYQGRQVRVATVMDLTERKRAEEALRERMKELTCLYAVNRDLQEGVSIDELCRRTVEHLVAAMRLPDITVPVIELDGKRFTCENHTDGLSHGLHAEIRVEGEAHGHLWVYYSEETPFLIPEEQNLLNGVAEALSRWLRRKRAEEALRESEGRFRELAHSITDVFFAMDEDLRYTFWNQASENLTGISANDAIGKSIFEVFPDREDTRRAVALYREVLKTQQPQSFVNEYRLGSKDYFFEISAYPSRSGLSVFTKDITERKQAEQETLQRNEELLALNAIAETLSSSLNLSEILDSALDKVLEILAVEAGGIYLVDETSRRLTLMAHHGVSEEFVSQVGELAVDEETIAQATEMGKAGKLILATELLLKDRTLLKAVTTAIRREKLRSYLQVIIRSKGTPAGLLVAASREGREFTAREEQLLSTIAQQIGLVVENVGLYEEQVNRVFQMDALRKTTLDITSQLDLDVLLHSIASRAIQLLNVTAGGLYLYRPEQDVLEWAVAIGDGLAPVGTTLRPGEGLAGKVWETGQSLVVDDYRHWEERAAVYDPYPLTAVVGAPVRWGATVLGVLCVNAYTPCAFSQADANLLSLFAGQAAIAIQNASLFAEQERRAREMTALYETSLDISGRFELSDVLRSIMNRGVELLHTAGGAVWLYQPEEDEIELAVDYGTPETYVGSRMKVGEGVAGKVLATRQAMAVEDYRQWEGRWGQLDSDTIGGILGVPLMWGEQPIGVLCVNETEKPRKFTEEEVRLLTLFASQAAVAIQNARLFAEQERRAREMTALYETSLDISGRLALTNVLRSIMNRGVELLHTAGGAVWLYRPAEDELELAIDYGTPETFVGGRMRVGEGVSGKVFADRQAMAVEDYRHWEGRSQKYDSDIIGGMLGVPLMWGEQAIGVLNVNEIGKPRKFTEEEIRLLGLFASQAAVAIQNARLHEETRRREAQLAALHDVALEIASELDLTVLLKTVAQRAIELLGGPRGGLYLYRPERQELEMVVNLGWEHDHLGTTLRLGEGACGRVAQTGQPLVVVDYANWEGRSVKFEDEGNFNVLAVPIKHGDSLLGALYVNDPDLERRFDEADIRLATMFTNQAAIAIENSRLHQEQHQRAQELAALHETALDITRHLDLDSLLTAVVERATRLLGGTTGELYLYRPELDDLKGVASVGLPPELQGTAVKVGEGLSGKVFETGEPLAVEDYEAWDGRSAQYAGYGFSRLLAAPLRYETHSVGALDVGRPADAPPFTEGDTNLLTHFADQAAIAIENAQLLNAVDKHKESLQKLSSRLIDAQEQERKRIAQELHDELGQALTAMSINLSAIDKQLGVELDPEIAERLAETDSLITRTLEQMREMALDLRPSMLDDLGLLPALRWYVKRYENRTGILVDLEVVGLELRLPEHIETAMYRVVQEALTNVARHARANRVDIRLQRRDSIVQAFIEDDGSGFDPAQVADREAQGRGVGLVGMRERIAALGGSLEIESHPGKGTRLTIELPLP